MVGVGVIFCLGEGASQGQGGAQERKQIPGATGCMDHFRQLSMFAGQIETAVIHGSHVSEAVRLLPPVVEIRGRLLRCMDRL